MSKKLVYKLIAISLAAGTALTQLPTTVLAATADASNVEENLGNLEELEGTEERPETPDPTPIAAEETTEAPVSYDSVFKIQREQITSIQTNNKNGHYGNSVIENALDGNPSTHWETNKANNSNYKNAVTVTFADLTEIATIKYTARQGGAAMKGFPLEYNLYYSTTESGEDFQLLKHGSYASASKTASIEVTPTEVRRIRFEFVQAKENWASIAELDFYKYDELADKIDGVFTDGTYSALSEEYKSEEKLNALLALAKNHPDKAKYEKLLQDAMTLLQNPGAFNDRVVTASQRGTFGSERARTQISWNMYSFDSTGYYVTPGETIQVYVEADENGPMPQLVFGQIAKDKNDWRRFYTLKPGWNTITAQEFSKMNPAAIYVYNPALPENQAYAPRVRIEGGTKFPLYVHSKTDPAEFEQELRDYLENVSYNDNDFADGNPNGYNYNIAEVTSENCTISTSAAGCLKGITAVEGKTIADTMDVWEDMYYSYAQYSGFNTEDPTDPDYMPRVKFNCRVFCQGPFGWADNGYNGFNGGNSAKRDNNFFSSIVNYNSIPSGGWAIFHEIGHSYDSAPLGISESTNNLYSLMMQDKYLDSNRLEYGGVWNKVKRFHNAEDRSAINAKEIWTYLAIINQLEITYGRDTLYGNAQKIARKNENGIMNGLNKYERMDVAMSMAAGVNLTSHFEYYGLPIGDAAKARIADLPVDGKKTWYVCEKSVHDAIPFTNADAKPTLQTSGNGSNIVLTMSMDEPDNALLCYEVYRDGEYLGQTYTNTFTDTTSELGHTYSYTAVAYDRKLNVSQPSDAVLKNSSEPTLSAEESVLLTLRQEFDPLSFVTAADVNGNDISDRIAILENTVDAETRGTYSITYQVADELGNQTTLTLPVRVVSKATYLSDMNWTSGEIGYGSIRKDKSVSQKTLSLLTKNGERTFSKGIGTHANSTITYDLSKSNADTFEAYVGVDGAMRTSTVSSVTFEVYVDGEKKFDSGLMKSSTKAQYVNVDVKGAKELKLVVTDGGNNNGSDHADWADAKLVSSSSNPVISGLQNYTFQLGDAVDVDFMENVTAVDVEDGDLSDAITMDTDFNPDKAGVYEVTYTVTDSDGNTTTETRSIAVVNASVYATDVAWTKANAGWGSVQKDKSVSGAALRLNNGTSAWQSYEKGIGTHANSTIVYDLTDKDLYAFTSYVGVDGAMKNSGVSSITFEVYVDGVKKFDSGLMRSSSQQQFVNVPLNGAKELKLVVTGGGNGIGSDHADWADAKFLTIVDKQGLEDLIAEAEALGESIYTEDSWQTLTASLENAKQVLKSLTATPEQIADAAAQLQDAIQSLVQDIDRSALEDVLGFANAITDKSYLDPSLKHGETRWNNFVSYRDVVENLEKDIPQTEIDRQVKALISFIEEIGQEYVRGEKPVAFTDLSELNELMEFADQITDKSYLDPSLKHGETRWNNFVAYRDVVENLEKDIPQTEIDRQVKALLSFIEEIGQTYTPGEAPVPFETEAE